MVADQRDRIGAMPDAFIAIVFGWPTKKTIIRLLQNYHRYTIEVEKG